MKYLLPGLALILATAAQAHEGGHLHPHEANGWFAGALLLAAGLAGCYLIGRVRR